MLEAAFWKSIQEEPEDDAPRLIYADWLEEQGDPALSARAEFIRVQCELARTGDDWTDRRDQLEGRERALWKKHGKAWSAPLKPFSNKFAFVRGFPDQVLVHGKVFRDRADEVLSAAPVFSIRLRKAKEEVEDIGKMPALERLISLSLYWNHIGLNRAQKFFKSPHLSRLHELDLLDNDIRPGGLQALVAADMPRLRSLNLSGNDLKDDGARALADSSLLEQLRTPGVGDNAITDEGAAAIFRSPHGVNLTSLDLSTNVTFGEGAAAGLAGCPHQNLRHLTLAGCFRELSLNGTRTLTSARCLTGLESLNFRLNTLAAGGWKALLGSRNLANLTSLDLSYTDLGERGLEALAAAPFLDRLSFLSLNMYQGIKPSAWEKFFAADRFGRLSRISLSQSGLGDAGLKALASTSSLSGLRELNLRHACTPKGAASLAGSPHLANLAVLDLRGAEIGDAGAKALAKSPHLSRLRKLHVSWNVSYQPLLKHVGDAGKAALLERFGKEVVEV